MLLAWWQGWAYLDRRMIRRGALLAEMFSGRLTFPEIFVTELWEGDLGMRELEDMCEVEVEVEVGRWVSRWEIQV